jgi:hypothetical protein
VLPGSGIPGVSSIGTHLTFTAVPLQLSAAGPGAVVSFVIAGLVSHLLGGAAVGPRWSFLLSGAAVVLAGLVSLRVLLRRLPRA